MLCTGESRRFEMQLNFVMIIFKEESIGVGLKTSLGANKLLIYYYLWGTPQYSLLSQVVA